MEVWAITAGVVVTDLLKLGALAATAITKALPDWAEAERLIKRGHRAAYLAGLAERLGVPLDSALLSEQRLSRAERKEVDSQIAQQLKYWRAFADEGQVNDARAAMYGRATRETYSKARWGDWDLPFHPCEGTECLTNCRCHWTVDDHGDGTGSATWHLGATERHCTTCPSRASDSPYDVRRR